MLNLRHVDLVVVLVRADALDSHDAHFEIHPHGKPIIIAPDFEDDPLGVNDARSGVELFHVGARRPIGLTDFTEPGVQRGLNGGLVFVACQAVNEVAQGAPGYHAHCNACHCPKWDKALSINAKSAHDVCEAILHPGPHLLAGSHVQPRWLRRQGEVSPVHASSGGVTEALFAVPTERVGIRLKLSIKAGALPLDMGAMRGQSRSAAPAMFKVVDLHDDALTRIDGVIGRG
jgi:hypothetical protein